MFNKIKWLVELGMFLVIGILYVGLNPDHCTADPYYELMIMFPGANIAQSEDGTQATADYWQDGYHYYVTYTAGQSGDYTVVYDSNGNLVTSGTQVTCSDYIYNNLIGSTSTAKNEEATTQIANETALNTNNSDKTSDSQTNNSKQESTEEIEAAWSETNRVESTCIEAGFVEYKNTLTGDTKTEVLELTEHDYVETKRVDATCTEDGKVIYTCSVCGDIYEEAITATGHTTEIITAKEPTWFTTGTQQEICSVCGEIISETELPQTCPLPLAGVIAIIIVIVSSISGAVLLVIRKNKLSK